MKVYNPRDEEPPHVRKHNERLKVYPDAWDTPRGRAPSEYPSNLLRLP